jgi:hypothetical protein
MSDNDAAYSGPNYRLEKSLGSRTRTTISCHICQTTPARFAVEQCHMTDRLVITAHCHDETVQVKIPNFELLARPHVVLFAPPEEVGESNVTHTATTEDA